MKTTEEELAKHVLAYLESENWTTYQEVPFRGDTIDIVATRGPVIGVIECKQALGLPVLEQCYRALPFAHFVWAAVWKKKRAAGSKNLITKVAKDNGIGILEANLYNHTVKEDLHPAFRRKLAKSPILKEVLKPEHAQGFKKAGTNRGPSWTPFQATCRDLTNVVIANPGISLKDAIYKIKHHYASDTSARACLKQMIETGVIKGLKLVKDGKSLTLWPINSKL